MPANWLRSLYHYFDAVSPTIGEWFARTVLRSGRRVVDTRRGRFYIDALSYFGQQLLEGEEHEPETGLVLRTYLSPGSVFVDLGANEGYFCVQASNLCDGGGVYLQLNRNLVVIKSSPRTLTSMTVRT